MEIEEDRLCRLCLKTVSNEFFEQIAGNIKEHLEVLQLELNFQIGEEQVLCGYCKERIKKCLDFKLASLDTETLIGSLYNCGGNLKLDLKKVYLQQNNYVDTADTFKDQEVCRFCMKLNLISSCKPLIELEEDMLEKCIPELNFNLTKDNLVCDSCLNSLKFYFQFVQNCVGAEGKIIRECKFDNVIDDKRSMTEIKLNSDDEFCCDIEETKIVKAEIIFENGNEKLNMENDTKMTVKVNVVKVERNGETTEQLQEKESEYVDFGGLSCETEEINQLHTEIKIEKEDEEFFGENLGMDIITDADDHVVKSEVNENLSQLQSGELKMVHEPNEVQTMQSDIESIQDLAVYKCESCSFITKYKSSLKTHQLTHRELSEVKVYKCESCLFITKRKSSLKTHQLTHRELSEVNVYTCKSCAYVAKTRGNLKSHTLTHEQLSEATIYKCESCSYKTKYKSNLNKHLLLHRKLSEVKVYKCERCAYVTKTRGNLKPHTLTHQQFSEVTKYKCGNCSFVTKTKKDLNSHTLIHRQLSEVTLHRCVSCSYVTKRKGSLKTHTLTHRQLSEVTTYKCDSCLFITKHRNSLKKHQLTHREFSEVKVYKCESCAYVAKSRRNLKSHTITHQQLSKVTKYKCGNCSFVTKTKKDLKTHTLTHRQLSQVTTYKCDSCLFITKHKKSLKLHQLTLRELSEVKVHKCESCSFKTKHKGSLKTHLRIHRKLS